MSARGGAENGPGEAGPWAPAAPPDDLERLRIDREFVCLLAAPMYVLGLVDQGYLEIPAFRAYIRYLQYWRRPPYVRYLPYPGALFFLEKLADPRFLAKILSSTDDLGRQATVLNYYCQQQVDRIRESQYRRGRELEAWRRARAGPGGPGGGVAGAPGAELPGGEGPGAPEAQGGRAGAAGGGAQAAFGAGR